MKRKVILISLIVLVFAACFIPVTQQKSISINAPFLNVFVQLSNPLNWEKWRADIRPVTLADSSRIELQKDTSSFEMRYRSHKLNVRLQGYTVFINDAWNKKLTSYYYIVVPAKQRNTTSVTVYKNVFSIIYLIGKITPFSFDDTHVDDLKRFMETDSLHYGFNIFKTRVPDTNLVEIKRNVLIKDKFTTAATMKHILEQYIKKHHVKKTQPLIAQFLPLGKDSIHINVGFYINKEVKRENDVIFTRMPRGGPLYCAIYRGRFDHRSKAYTALHQYFNDHLYQLSILPFEIYLDDKLPLSDTTKVITQVTFASYF